MNLNYLCLPAIAIYEWMKFKAREREIEETAELDTEELLKAANDLDLIISKQSSDILKLETVVRIYRNELEGNLEN